MAITKVTSAVLADLNVTTDKIANDSISYNKLANEFTTSVVIPSIPGPLQNLYPGLAIDVIWYYGTTNGSGIDLYFYAINPNIAINELVGATFTFTGDNIGSIPAGSYIIGSNGASFVDFDEYYVEIVLNPTQQTDTEDGFGYGQQVTLLQGVSVPTVDFSTAQVFTKTLTANDTLTFSNVSTGMVKDLVITGDFTLTLPASVKVISGTYDGTVSNLIQIASTNGSTEQWATISQQAV